MSGGLIAFVVVAGVAIFVLCVYWWDCAVEAELERERARKRERERRQKIERIARSAQAEAARRQRSFAQFTVEMEQLTKDTIRRIAEAERPAAGSRRRVTTSR